VGAGSLPGSLDKCIYSGLSAAMSGVGKLGGYLGDAGGWKAVGKVVRRAAGPLAAVSSGLGQYLEDEHEHPKMPLDRRIGRAIGQAVTVGGAAVVGGFVGNKIGTAGGTVVGGVFGDGVGAAPGAAVGGFVGEVAGSVAASTVVDHYNDSTVDAFGDGFSIPLPAGWEVSEEVDGAALVAAEPDRGGGFRSNVVVTIETRPVGLGLAGWAERCTGLLSEELDHCRVLDAAEAVIGRLPARRALVHYAHPELGGVNLEQWMLLYGERGFVVSASTAVPDYDDRCELMASVAGSLRTEGP
jgi:hypothetical protein